MEGWRYGNRKSRLVVIAVHLCSESVSSYTNNIVPVPRTLLGMRVIDLDTKKIKDITLESVIDKIESLNVCIDLIHYTTMFRGLVLGDVKPVYTYDNKLDEYIQIWPDGRIVNVGSGNAEMQKPSVRILNKKDGDSYRLFDQFCATGFTPFNIDNHNNEDCRYIAVSLTGYDRHIEFSIKTGKFLDLQSGRMVSLGSLKRNKTVREFIDVNGFVDTYANKLYGTTEKAFMPVNGLICCTVREARSERTAYTNRYVIIVRKTPYDAVADVNSIEFYVGEKSPNTSVYSKITVMKLSMLCWIIENTESEMPAEVYENYGGRYDSESICITTLLAFERFLKSDIKLERIMNENTDRIDRINMKSAIAGMNYNMEITPDNIITHVNLGGVSEFKLPEGTVLGSDAIDWSSIKKLDRLVLSNGCSIEKKTFISHKLNEFELHGEKAYSSVLSNSVRCMKCSTITVGSDISAKILKKLMKKYTNSVIDIRVRGQLSEEDAEELVYEFLIEPMKISEEDITNTTIPTEYGMKAGTAEQAMSKAESITEIYCDTKYSSSKNAPGITVYADRLSDRLDRLETKTAVAKLRNLGGGVDRKLDEVIGQLRELEAWLNEKFTARKVKILREVDGSDLYICDVTENYEEKRLEYVKHYTDITGLYVYRLEGIHKTGRSTIEETGAIEMFKCDTDGRELLQEWKKKQAETGA